MEKLYTLKEAKKILGVTTRTIQRWDKQGKIKVVRTVGGRRRIPESEIKRILGLKENKIIVGYIRATSRENLEEHLEEQKQLILNYAKERGYKEVHLLSDLGSGLNEKRESFLKLLEMVFERKVSKVIITHKDRLTIFGFETLKRVFSAFGTEIEIINCKEEMSQEEILKDLKTILLYFAKKLYGSKSKKSVKKLLNVLNAKLLLNSRVFKRVKFN